MVHTAVFSIIFFHNVLPIALRRESILTKKDCGNDIISTIFATNFCFYLSKKNPHLKRRNNSSKISCRPVLDDVHCPVYTLRQKSSTYLKIHILKISLLTKYTYIIFHKIHIFKISFLTTFTF